MGAFHLPEHVRFCDVQGQRVFLDLARDRYFRLPAGADATFQALLPPGCGAELTGRAVEPLLRAGAIVAAPAGRPIQPTIHPPAVRSLVEDQPVQTTLSLPDLLEAWALLAWSRLVIARKRLPTALRAPPEVLSPKTAMRDEIVLRFLSVRRFVPITYSCLQDSLALSRFLRRRGLACRIVIGVKLHPFSAHCWVEDDRTVLNDALATARNFVPVLVA